MPTGKRLLEESMPHNYKQGSVYPTHYDYGLEKEYGNRNLVMLDMFVKWVRQKYVNN